MKVIIESHIDKVYRYEDGQLKSITLLNDKGDAYKIEKYLDNKRYGVEMIMKRKKRGGPIEFVPH